MMSRIVRFWETEQVSIYQNTETRILYFSLRGRLKAADYRLALDKHLEALKATQARHCIMDISDFEGTKRSAMAYNNDCIESQWFQMPLTKIAFIVNDILPGSKRIKNIRNHALRKIIISNMFVELEEAEDWLEGFCVSKQPVANEQICLEVR